MTIVIIVRRIACLICIIKSFRGEDIRAFKSLSGWIRGNFCFYPFC